MIARPLQVSVALLALALPASPAAARDICVALPNATFVFRNVKKLKPGRAVPLSGIGILSGMKVAPLSGTAIMDSAGAIELGFSAYALLDGVPNEMFHATVDDTFSGPLQADASGDFLPDGMSVSLVPVDCKTVVIP